MCREAGRMVNSSAAEPSAKNAPISARGRIAWYDNARWLAGSLVVTTHVTAAHIYGGTPGVRGGIADWFHSVAYPMRLPLFSLLVGFFTPVLPTSKDFEKLLRYVAIPFALVTCLHVLWGIYAEGKVTFDPVVAPYTLWFMFAVLIWRTPARTYGAFETLCCSPSRFHCLLVSSTVFGCLGCTPRLA